MEGSAGIDGADNAGGNCGTATGSDGTTRGTTGMVLVTCWTVPVCAGREDGEGTSPPAAALAEAAPVSPIVGDGRSRPGRTVTARRCGRAVRTVSVPRERSSLSVSAPVPPAHVG